MVSKLKTSAIKNQVAFIFCAMNALGWASPAVTLPPSLFAKLAQAADQAPSSRALASPLTSPPLPQSDWAVNGYSPIGESWDASKGWLQNALFGTRLDQSRVKVYGLLEAGFTRSTSDHSNIPETYNLYPNRPTLDQAVLRIERMPDTVQTKSVDYGFRFTSISGTDYRFIAADGYFYDQIQKRNALYGFDMPEAYGLVYLPHVYQGQVIQFGRYTSPGDIEAQIAPQNYLYSHSYLFAADPETFTGINAQTRLSPYWTVVTGIHAGGDKSAWEKSSSLNAQLMLGWNDHGNRDSIWAGLNSIGSGKYKAGHDDLQVACAVWGHKFNDRWHMQTQAYYMWEYDGALGGSEVDGPSEPWAPGGGAGPIIHGQSHSIGTVNYLVYQVNKSDFLCYRTDMLDDAQGQRTGYPNVYTAYTLGYVHYFNPSLLIRPEIRFDNADKHAAYDNGTRKTQWTLAADVIFRF